MGNLEIAKEAVNSIKPISSGLFSLIGSKKSRTIDTLLQDIRKYEYLIESESMLVNSIASVTGLLQKSNAETSAQPIRKLIEVKKDEIGSKGDFFKNNIARYKERILLRKELIEIISKADYK
ncbi:MAG: hypothetical protein WCW13_07220 [archaeon]|jgi:hypothetical protein